MQLDNLAIPTRRSSRRTSAAEESTLPRASPVSFSTSSRTPGFFRARQAPTAALAGVRPSPADSPALVPFPRERANSWANAISLSVSGRWVPLGRAMLHILIRFRDKPG